MPASRLNLSAGWAIGTIAVIFGGIYGGMFTPTEAAGVDPIHFGIVMAPSDPSW
jgi:TRAP-type C4-dicarboxylate transport system permease large subunit